MGTGSGPGSVRSRHESSATRSTFRASFRPGEIESEPSKEGAIDDAVVVVVVVVVAMRRWSMVTRMTTTMMETVPVRRTSG